MATLIPAIACNLDANILSAALPLFEAEKVQAIEWSFDSLYAYQAIPPWFTELLHAFSDADRLVGHGVFFSLFSGKWTQKQAEWLTQLNNLSKEYKFDHVTEHFGFMTGEDFHKGAPISIPYTKATVALGIDRLKRIQEACNCPVGLENLAFSYSMEEVKKHGDFLHELVESVNGFIILDLHNLYCQLHNFEIGYADLIDFYPLDRVREIHISGGSWKSVQTRPDKQIRRDTHDESVPPAVFELLERTIPKCPHLKYVVLEQLGNGLATSKSKKGFQRDFLQMERILQHNATPSDAVFNSFLPTRPLELPDQPVEDAQLYAQQLALSHILETAQDYPQAQAMLATSNLAHSDWDIEHWESDMVETAIAIAQKWKAGFRHQS